MAKKLYEVRINRGKDNINWQMFFNNVSNLNAKAPGFEGVESVVIVSHHVDVDTVHLLCTSGFRTGKDDVTVEEITKKTLKKNHNIYADIVEPLFLRYDTYPNIQ